MFETIAAAVAPTVLEGLFGKRQAAKQMDFQAQQSATSYQRAVKDLRAAGLNPILAGTVGGASTPSGAMAPTPQFASNVGTALQYKRLKQEIKNLQAQENKTKTEQQILEGGRISKEFGLKPAEAIDNIVKDVSSSAKGLLNTVAPLDPFKMRYKKPSKMKNVNTDIGDVSP